MATESEGQTSALSGGFSLLELLTAISVSAIGLVVAVPSFASAISSWKLTTAANETLAGWHAARMEAVRANQVVIACATIDPRSENPSCSNGPSSGWLVFTDRDSNLQYSTGDKLVRTVAFTSRVVLVSQTDPLIVFYPDGRAWADMNGGELKNLRAELCIDGNSPGSRELIIELGSSMFVRKRDVPGCGVG